MQMAAHCPPMLAGKCSKNLRHPVFHRTLSVHDHASINATMGANAEDGSCDYIYDFDWNGTTASAEVCTSDGERSPLQMNSPLRRLFGISSRISAPIRCLKQPALLPPIHQNT
jgi:hypothetical protein